jgi:Uncharacterised protein family (UPF0014)
MILGNTLNGVSLGLDRLGSELSGRRDQVEGSLALGATRWEAARPLVQQAIKTGLIPTVLVVGSLIKRYVIHEPILAALDQTLLQVSFVFGQEGVGLFLGAYPTLHNVISGP